MGFWEVFFIGIGLAMDAFAVSVGKGLATPKYEPKGSLMSWIVVWRVPDAHAAHRLLLGDAVCRIY